MHLFLTGVLPLLAHDHASAAAFLTCRHHNFHASIIPEFLSDEERVKSFCETRQHNQLRADKQKKYKNLYNLFVQTPLMQFSPSLLLRQKECFKSILKPLLETKYFTRTLQRCSVVSGLPLTDDLLQGLSKIRSLTSLGFLITNRKQLEIILNSFPSLETLAVCASDFDSSSKFVMKTKSPPPAAKTLRNLTLVGFDPLQFLPCFGNLRKLTLKAENSSQNFDLRPLSSSLPLLTDLTLLNCFSLENIESLNNLVNLSTLKFFRCDMTGLSFLTQENSLPQLITLSIESCEGLSTFSFASLENAPNLRALEIFRSDFNNECLQHLEDMVHLRKLNLSRSSIVGDSRSLNTLMKNSFQLEELNLEWCNVGNQGVIAGALYNTHSRLRVLNLGSCNLVDDDMNGIGALKNTLEVLVLNSNSELTNEALVHCTDLVKLKVLNLDGCHGINDLSPLKDCLNLEQLNVSNCDELLDISFKVFSDEPNSFPNLCALGMSDCTKLTAGVFEHLSKNNHLVYQLKELHVEGLSEILAASESARNNLCQLKGLRRLDGIVSSDYLAILGDIPKEEIELMAELMRRIKNIESLGSIFH